MAFHLCSYSAGSYAGELTPIRAKEIQLAVSYFLKLGIEEKNIFVFGQSRGGWSTLFFAAKNPARRTDFLRLRKIKILSRPRRQNEKSSHAPARPAGKIKIRPASPPGRRGVTGFLFCQRQNKNPSSLPARPVSPKILPWSQRRRQLVRVPFVISGVFRRGLK